MSMINWNSCPVGTTHCYVPVSSIYPLKEFNSWEKWTETRVYYWNDSIEEWEILAYNKALLAEDRRVINPNVVDYDEK